MEEKNQEKQRQIDEFKKELDKFNVGDIVFSKVRNKFFTFVFFSQRLAESQSVQFPEVSAWIRVCISALYLQK